MTLANDQAPTREFERTRRAIDAIGGKLTS
jgi:hypothetical protein